MKRFWNWIKNEAGGRVLRLEGPIDEESFWGDEVTPKAFREELEADSGDIIVWINSPGGNVFAAAEIYTMLRDYQGTVTVQDRRHCRVSRLCDRHGRGTRSSCPRWPCL